MIDRAPVGADRVHRDEAVRAVEQVDDADLRVGEAHERLRARPSASAPTSSVFSSRTNSAYARARASRAREVLVRARQLGERALALGERRAQARVLLEQERVHLREAPRDRAELVAPRRQRAASGSSRPVASSASSSCAVVPAMSRAIQTPLPSAMMMARRSTVRVARCESRRPTRTPSARASSASSSASLAELGQDAAHLVGARLALVGRRADRASSPCSRARICGSLIVVDPLVDEPPERGDALVLHAVLGDVLRLGEDALEVVARLLVRARGTSGRP